MNSKNRLFIITGKGGVGKTTIALSIVRSLNESGINAKYLTFKSGSISNPKSNSKKTDLPSIELDLMSCATEYVGKKMKSQTIAGWVVKTPFFKALMNMLPGFSYLIYLGKTIELLKKAPNLVLVLDSPSSGHALTMFESMKNYQEIFQSGLLFEDTNKVISQFYAPDFTRTIILTIPTIMAQNEGLELAREISEIKPIKTQVICNNVISKIDQLNTDQLPQILKDKIKTEKEVIETFDNQVSSYISYCVEMQDKSMQIAIGKDLGSVL